jgi:hypothetical protein
MNNLILPLFFHIDDFCESFEPNFNHKLLASGSKRRLRKSTLQLSEIMTIIVCFQQSSHRTFKHFYLNEVCLHLRDEFPRLVSYNRFVELMPLALIPLSAFY